MIARLAGKIIERQDNALIIDIHGIGYQVAVLPDILHKVGEGEEIVLHVYHHISDSDEALYGFLTKDYLQFFKLLLTVPSVGPRTAMNILEVAPPSVLQQAVVEADITLLTKVSGVGKKTAGRILVELREKITAPQTKHAPGSLQHETIEALVSIGFKPSQARAVVAKLPKEVKTVEEAVKAALQKENA